MQYKIKELNQSLQHSEKERLKLQKQLEECNEQKEIYLKRLNMVTVAHKRRISELHYIIGELTKKLKAKYKITALQMEQTAKKTKGKRNFEVIVREICN